MITEDLIYYLWQTKQLYDLATTSGEKISVIDYGSRNHASGPDFVNAKIKINGIIWAGSVEMHVLSSDWLRHTHDSDPAYHNVILHVVYQDDKPVTYSSRQNFRIPTTEIKKYINPIIMKNYTTLRESTTWIPCEKLLNEELTQSLSLRYPALAGEKLQISLENIHRLYVNNQFDYGESLYQLMAHYFGGPQNGPIFERLANEVPLHILHKNIFDPLRIQSILFGVSSLMQKSAVQDDYSEKLNAEFAIQKAKYGFKVMEGAAWKYAGMMPSGQPAFRLAQMIAVLLRQTNLLDDLLNASCLSDIRLILSAEADVYWQTHYQFGKDTSKHSTVITKPLQDRIIINAFVPFLFFYGSQKDDQYYKDFALQLLDEMKPEENQTITKWKKLGVRCETSLESQALIYLRHQYCSKSGCLNCVIGNKIVSGK